MLTFEKMVKVVPEGVQGVARVRHVVVSKHDAQMAAIRGELLNPGPLAILTINGELMMSDGYNEHRTNYEAVERANGDVLIAGLGLGMVLVPILRKPEVRSVVVLEKYREVADLVAPAISAYVPEATTKLRVLSPFDVLGREFPGGSFNTLKWDTIYFDIWPEITTDNLEEIAKLKRRYARRLNRNNPKAWMGAWVEDELRRRKRRDMREGYGYNIRCGTFR